MTWRDPEAGIVLVNVLVVLAIAAGVVVVLLDAQDRALARSAAALDVKRAGALAMAGEASAVVALRRDLETAPEIDHLEEPWAAVAQEPIELDGGRFALTIRDVNARFDINRLVDRRVADLEAWARLAAASGLEEETARGAAARIVQGGPVDALEALPGLTPDDLALLARHVTALRPERQGWVNLNTAGPTVIAALAGGPEAAARLVGLRARRGYLDAAAMAAAGVPLPPGTRLTSDLWEVATEAEVGTARARLTSVLSRTRDAGGGGAVTVVSRDPFGRQGGGPPPVGLD